MGREKVLRWESYMTLVKNFTLSISVPSSPFAHYSLKKFIEVHFNRSKVFLLYFTTHMTSIYGEKVRQKCGLFMQNKCLCRISSFYEKNNRRSWRLKDSTKTFLNQLESMGFYKLISRTFLQKITLPLQVTKFYNKTTTFKFVVEYEE